MVRLRVIGIEDIQLFIRQPKAILPFMALLSFSLYVALNLKQITHVIFPLYFFFVEKILDENLSGMVPLLEMQGESETNGICNFLYIHIFLGALINK